MSLLNCEQPTGGGTHINTLQTSTDVVQYDVWTSWWESDQVLAPS